MPPHPTWNRTLSGRDRDRIARLVTTQPRSSPTWTIDDIRRSLTVRVADESRLPARPACPIADIADLMTVMVRGRHAAGDAARVVFVDGRTHRTVGEVRTGRAPHLMDHHPRDPRWAYVRDDMGWVHKIDLYSLQTVRKVRAGLNGASLAVSRDGRFVAAGSYVPHALVIVDAATLEPLKLLPLRSTGADGRPLESDAGMLLATPFADVFVVALEQAGQVWIVDLGQPDFPVTVIDGVGRHLHDGFVSADGRQVSVERLLQLVDQPAHMGHRVVDGLRRAHVDAGHLHQFQRRCACRRPSAPAASAARRAAPFLLHAQRHGGRRHQAHRVGVRVQAHVVVRLAHPGHARAVVDLHRVAPEARQDARPCSSFSTAAVMAPPIRPAHTPGAAARPPAGGSRSCGGRCPAPA
jgi:hypothetical protein